MKTETSAYSSKSTRSDLYPRYTVALSFDDDNLDVTYLTSHSDCLTPSGVPAANLINGCVTTISGQSQKVSPDTSQHTIGSINIKVMDVGLKVSTKINDRLTSGEGLRHKRIVVYKGFKDLPLWADYNRVLTYLVDGVSYKNGIYTFECSDIQRQSKTDILEPHQGVLTSTITNTAMTIPITVAGGIDKFKTVEHDAIYTANPLLTVGYIKIDDEIICHSGWTDGTYTALTVVERGALNTVAVAHTVTASEEDQRKKVDEYIYLEMATPKLIYALLTGVLYGQTGTLPDHWNLQINTNYVRLSDFTGIGSDFWNTSDNSGRIARFQGLKSSTGKQFIEKELLIWVGAFMPIYSDGSYGFKRLQNVLPDSPYSTLIDESQIVSYSELTYDLKSVINNISVKWNWIDNLERYTKTTQLIDSNSISKHGKANIKNYEFKGVFTGIHSDSDIRNLFNQIRDRYASPPLRLKLTVTPQWDRLDVGDTIKVECFGLYDYNSDATLSRVFEIQQITTDWINGKVTLDLFGGVEPASREVISQSYVMADSFYTTGTDITTVLTVDGSGNITVNGDLPAGTYYYAGDLTLNSGITVTFNGTVIIKAHTLTVNGDFVGTGRGHEGAVSGADLKYIEGVQGASGNPGVSFAPYFIAGYVMSNPGSEYNGRNYNPSPISSLNILNPDGLALTGLPTDLSGSSGSSGGQISVITTPVAAGGDGGDAGAGMLIITRGGAINAAGSITTHGTDGIIGDTMYYAYGDATVYAGTGVGGRAGCVMWLIDGNATYPEKSFVSVLSGDTPAPPVTGLLPKTGGSLIGNIYDSYGCDPMYDVINQLDTNVYFGYIPTALNGYAWFQSDEEKEVTSNLYMPISIVDSVTFDENISASSYGPV